MHYSRTLIPLGSTWRGPLGYNTGEYSLNDAPGAEPLTLRGWAFVTNREGATKRFLAFA